MDVTAPRLITFLSLLLQTIGISGSCYTSIFSFGDSLADTGNYITTDKSSKYNFLPYGQNFIYGPTGRCSNGRLVIDFIAQALGLPYVPPYLGHSTQDFKQGVNFAVAGATAIDFAFFQDIGVEIPTNYSLQLQLNWFKQLLPSLCASPSICREMLRNALFLMGEIGGNDYNFPFFQQKPLQEIQSIVPKVIGVISNTITALIELGAVTLMVPGDIPLGCSWAYLSMYESQNKDDYDPSTGCLNWLNEFSKFHNDLLQKELNRLRKIHQHATIIYADYYNVAMDMYRFPKQSGFRSQVVKPCLSGGPYNFNSGAFCGDVCDDPSSYVCWDGLHLTEAAYKYIATGILEGPFSSPRINISCTASSSYPHKVDHTYYSRSLSS